MYRSLTRLVLVALAVLSLALPAPAQEPTEHAVAFRRAEIRERSLGDSVGAAELYLEAARGAPDEAARARAELRAAVCLARTGDPGRAEEIAARWLDVELPAELHRLAADVLGGVEGTPRRTPEAREPAADPVRVVELEDELEQARLRLERSVGQAEGARQEIESLAAELRAKEREIAALRARLPPPEPETAEDALRLRREQLERQRAEARGISAALTAWAERLHSEGSFAEAREVLYDALERDPENARAKALLARVAAPLGDRERLHLRVREVLALAREVRAARLRAEVEYLLQQGRRLQERGDVEASVAPLENALALAGYVVLEDRGRRGLREEIEGLLRRAVAAGVPRAPVSTVAEEPLDAAWTDALRQMLSLAGREIEQGLALRFHDLDPLLPAASVVLPPAPVTDPPEGWTLSTQGADAAALIAAWLRGGEIAALATPGAAFDVVGSTAVVLADDETQSRLQARLDAASLAVAPAAEVEIVVVRAASGAWDERLRTRGLAPRTLAGGARATVLPPGDVDAMLAAADGGTVAISSRATFRAAHLQPFRLIGGGAGRSIELDVLPVVAGDPGAALRVETSWRPVGRQDAALLSQRALAGAPLAPGGALALHALTDPVRPSSDLIVVVRVGRSEAAPERPAPRSDRPETSATEHLLPRAVARVQELNAALLPLPAHPVPLRSAALEARLRRAAVGAVSVEVRGDRVLVVGPQESQDGVRELMGRLAAVEGPQRFAVEAFVVSAETEAALADVLPGLTKEPGSLVATATVRERDGVALRRLLASSARVLALTEPEVSTPPTVRVDAAYVVRTPYRRDIDVAPGESTSWGRAETGIVDQGFLLAIRPFGRDARDRDELDLSLRIVRVVGGPPRERTTPLGTVELLEPGTDVVAADLRPVLAEADTFVLAGLPNPFPAPDGASRLVLLVRPVR